MRTIIDLPAEQIEALDRLCEKDQISRAEAIRRAVALLVRHNVSASAAAFGLWRDRPYVDGVEYQRQIRRREWRDVPARGKRR